MDKFPKFIIEHDALVLSRVTYHSDLVTDKNQVKGGGWFSFNGGTNTFTFYGESVDFGKAKMEDVLACVSAGNVYSNKHKFNSIAGDHNFAYNTGSEIISLPVDSIPDED